MQINDLLVLRALLTHRSVKQTAELMNVTQPAITIRLNKLRDLFKDDILTRSGNEMVLTQKALQMIEPIKRITDELLQFIPQNQFDPSKYAVEIKLQIHADFIAYCASQVIDAFHAINKNHKVIIDSMSFSRTGDEANVSQDYDLIFGPYTRVKNFDDDVYYVDELVLIYDRFFQEPPAGVSFEEYVQLPHVAMSTETDKTIFSQALGFEKDPRNIVMHIASPKSAAPMLQDKYVLTSTITVAKVLGLNYLPFTFKKFPEVPVKAIYPSRLKFDAKNIWVRQVFKKTIMEILKSHDISN